MNLSKSNQDRIKNFIAYFILIILGIMFIIPFLWLISSSIKPASQLYDIPPKWLPTPATLKNFKDGWAILPFGGYLKNTLIIAVLGPLGTVLSCSFVAYGFARFKARGSKFMFSIVMATMMLPSQVTLIPTYIIFSKLGWVNSYKPIIVPQFFAVGAFYIFLLRQFFKSVPIEIDEAAKIDGCNSFQIFYKMILPLCKPVLVTVVLFSLINNWNDFMTQLIYINKESLYTVAIGLSFFSSKYGPQQINLLMAVSLLTLLPLLLMFFIAQKYFVQGISTTGLKG